MSTKTLSVVATIKAHAYSVSHTDVLCILDDQSLSQNFKELYIQIGAYNTIELRHNNHGNLARPTYLS